jgi:hypothetical protein
MTGHIRRTDEPNRRVQDGITKPWLCSGCEARFSRDETQFANKLFYPWLKGQQLVNYEEWLLKFCVSVSWRVLKHCKGLNPNHAYTNEQNNLAHQAETTWRKYLLDQAPHPSSFEQHLLIFDIIKETTIPDLPNNINRFMTGAIIMDIVGSDRTLMTYAKIGRFSIFGTIQKGLNRWEGTKVHVKRGVLKPGKFVVPYGLLSLFKEKSSIAANANQNVSEAQYAKIEEALFRNIDGAVHTDQFSSMLADADMFGEHVVLREPKKAGADTAES